MTESDTTSDDDEYRPTDWLATCELSYGVGHVEDQAVQAALRYAAPFDGDDPVQVTVWNLYADSWQKHGPSGPERGAELVEQKVYELDPSEANSAADAATDATTALSRALGNGEVVREVKPDDAE